MKLLVSDIQEIEPQLSSVVILEKRQDVCYTWICFDCEYSKLLEKKIVSFLTKNF